MSVLVEFTITFNVENVGFILLSDNSLVSQRTKHIYIHHHFFWYYIEYSTGMFQGHVINFVTDPGTDFFLLYCTFFCTTIRIFFLLLPPTTNVFFSIYVLLSNIIFDWCTPLL